jgi:hypothetical protein
VAEVGVGVGANAVLLEPHPTSRSEIVASAIAPILAASIATQYGACVMTSKKRQLS